MLTGRWSFSWIHVLKVGFISLYDVVKSNESRQRIFGQPCLCVMLSMYPRLGLCTSVLKLCFFQFFWVPVSTFVQKGVRTCCNFVQLIPDFTFHSETGLLGSSCLVRELPNQPCLIFVKRMPGIKVIPAHFMSICEPQQQSPGVLAKDY